MLSRALRISAALCQLCARGVQAGIQTNVFLYFVEIKGDCARSVQRSVSDTPAKITAQRAPRTPMDRGSAGMGSQGKHKRRLEEGTDAPDNCRCVCGKVCSNSAHLRLHQDFSGCVPVSPMESGHHTEQPMNTGDWASDLLLAAARGRTAHGVPRAAMTAMKQSFVQAVKDMKLKAKHRLELAVAKGEPDLGSVMEEVMSIPSFLSQRDSELALLRASPAYVKPVKRYLGKCPKSGEEFYAVDSPLDKNLEAMWLTQPELFRQSEAFAGHLSTHGPKQSTLEYSPDLVINDTVDGVEFGRFVTSMTLSKYRWPLTFLFLCI